MLSCSCASLIQHYTMKTHEGVMYRCTIIDLRIICWCVVTIDAPVALPPGKEPTAPVGWETLDPVD
jgi:hypothetical protein